MPSNRHGCAQELYDNIDAYLADTAPIPKGPLPQHTPSGTPRDAARARQSGGVTADEGAALSREQLAPAQAPAASSDEAAAAAVAADRAAAQARRSSDEDTAGAAATEHLQDFGVQKEASAALQPEAPDAGSEDQSEAGSAGPVDDVGAGTPGHSGSDTSQQAHSYTGEAHTLGALYAAEAAERASTAASGEAGSSGSRAADSAEVPSQPAAAGDDAAAPGPEASEAEVVRSPPVRDALEEGTAAVQHIARAASNESAGAPELHGAMQVADAPEPGTSEHAKQNASGTAGHDDDAGDEQAEPLSPGGHFAVADASVLSAAQQHQAPAAQLSAHSLSAHSELPKVSSQRSTEDAALDPEAGAEDQDSAAGSAAHTHHPTLEEQYGVADAAAVASSGVHGLFEEAEHHEASDAHDDAQLRALSGGEATVTDGRPSRGLPMGEGAIGTSSDACACPELDVPGTAPATSRAEGTQRVQSAAARCRSARKRCRPGARAVVEASEPAAQRSASADALDEAAAEVHSNQRGSTVDVDAVRAASISSPTDALATANGMRAQPAPDVEGTAHQREAAASDVNGAAQQSTSSPRSDDTETGSGHAGLQHHMKEGYVPVRSCCLPWQHICSSSASAQDFPPSGSCTMCLSSLDSHAGDD